MATATENGYTVTSGPDKVLKADSFSSCSLDQPVRLRQGSGSPDDPLSATPVSVITAFRRTVARSPNANALAAKVDGEWKYWTYKQYYDDVWKAAKSLIKLGLKPLHGVGIIGFNSPEWLIANVAAVFAGGISAGFYTTNSAEACQYVANHATCDVMVVENEAQLTKIRQVWDQLPSLRAVVQYNGQPTTAPDSDTRPVYSWSEFLKIGKSVSDEELEERIRQQAVNKCCTLIYTSGTTGKPKGVMLSHDNMTWTAMIINRTYSLEYGTESIVSYLPLSHIAAQILDIYLMMIAAGTTYFAQPDALKGSLFETMRAVQPTVFVGVPRVYEKIQENMTDLGSRQGFLQRLVMDWARSVGLRGNMSLMNGGSVPYGWTLANLLVFQKLRQLLGYGRCKVRWTSAAPISRKTLDFFMSLNLPLMEVFGMSECSGPFTLPTACEYRISSAGKEMLGTTIEIADPDNECCGEICGSGRNVMMGYLNDEEKTRETIDDRGFLHSGDIGKLDEDGFLYITGRIKELLITAGGENVAPVPIEDAVKEALPCVSNCMLIGDKKKYLSILLTLKCELCKDTAAPTDKLTESAAEWFRSKRSSSSSTDISTVTDVIQACTGTDIDTSLVAAIQAGIDKANERAPSRAQRIQKWTILPRDFSLPGGELGPTMKLKRHSVVKLYEQTINSMYE